MQISWALISLGRLELVVIQGGERMQLLQQIKRFLLQPVEGSGHTKNVISGDQSWNITESRVFCVCVCVEVANDISVNR